MNQLPTHSSKKSLMLNEVARYSWKTEETYIPYKHKASIC